MIKNRTSPLSFEKNNIRSLIINQRKLKLIEQMEQTAYEDARKTGDVEVYSGQSKFENWIESGIKA